jgi:hypothetical protein
MKKPLLAVGAGLALLLGFAYFHVTASSAFVDVSTVPELEAAVANLTSGQVIRVAAGRYALTQQLRIRNGVTNVSLVGATGNRDDVVIVGSGMNTPGVNIAIKVENAQDVRIADLSVGEAFWHPIQLQGEQGAERVRVSNVRLFDAGQQFLKSTTDYAVGPNGVDDVIVENSLIEFTVIGPPDGYTEGIDVHHGANWIIRNNVFRNIRVPPGATYVNRPGVLMWGGSRDTVVSGNTFINCERAIIFGQGGEVSGHSHSGGLIVNNFIYRTEPHNADAGISIWDSPGTRVYHNTVIQNGTYPAAIEYRFASTTNVEIINNLTDGLILQRENASAVVTNNYTAATSSLFVNPAGGDLHLLPTAAVAIDQGLSVGVAADWDTEARPLGAAPDLGADEVDASPQPPSRINVALAANGATALASSTYPGCCGASEAINGERRGHPWAAGGGWNDGTGNAWPDWLEITFNGAKTLDEIDVFTLQDNYAAPSDPTPAMTFTLYGLRDFVVQYWTGASWLPVPGGTFTNNSLVWRQITFAPLTTTKIRISVTAGANGYSRITEVEAFGTTGAVSSPPTVTLTAPGNGATYAAPASIAWRRTPATSMARSCVWIFTPIRRCSAPTTRRRSP